MITIKQKLLRTKRTKHLEALRRKACFVYNHFLDFIKTYYRIFKKHIPYNKLQNYIPTIRNRRFSWWKQLGSQCVQDILRRIYAGYDLFFSERKRGNKKIGIPKFKKLRKYKSITYTQAGWSFDGDHTVTVQGKNFKFYKSREIKNVKRITVKVDAVGDWWVCFSCDINDELPVKFMTGDTAGFDFGLKTFLTSNENKQYQSPLFYAKNHKQTKKLQKLLSKKQKGSNNRHKARKNLARHHRRIENQRKEHHAKLALSLVRQYDIICFENLNIKAMKMLWGKKVSDLSFYSFMLTLQNMARKHGKKVVKIDRFYPSSKTCHNCGEIKEDLRLEDRMWTCNGCKMTHDRDHNAAINIYQVGTSTCGGDKVRPTLAVGTCS
jgi:putative transposase